MERARAPHYPPRRCGCSLSRRRAPGTACVHWTTTQRSVRRKIARRRTTRKPASRTQAQGRASASGAVKPKCHSGPARAARESIGRSATGTPKKERDSPSGRRPHGGVESTKWTREKSVAPTGWLQLLMMRPSFLNGRPRGALGHVSPTGPRSSQDGCSDVCVRYPVVRQDASCWGAHVTLPW